MRYIISQQNKNKTKKDFEADLRSIHKILDEKDIDDLSIDEMNRLVFLHERSALSYRNLLEHLDKPNMDFVRFYKKKGDTHRQSSTIFDKNNPVQCEVLCIDDQKLIHIFTPFLFKKRLNESFLLAEYLNLSLHSNEHLKEEMMNCFKDQKVIVHVIRCAEKFNPQVHCDNDNLEISELINTLFANLMISDSPLKTSFMSDFVQITDKENEGMHIILAPYCMDLYGEKLLKLIAKTY